MSRQILPTLSDIDFADIAWRQAYYHQRSGSILHRQHGGSDTKQQPRGGAATSWEIPNSRLPGRYYSPHLVKGVRQPEDKGSASRICWNPIWKRVTSTAIPGKTRWLTVPIGGTPSPRESMISKPFDSCTWTTTTAVQTCCRTHRPSIHPVQRAHSLAEPAVLAWDW